MTIERDPTPRYIERGDGAYQIDIDGRRFLDLNNNFTTLIHGHAFGPIVEAVERQLRDGSCFANPTEIEIDIAGLLCDRVPALDHIRFVNTGTEAVMFAIKAARAFTGRPGIAKIEGAYHGAYDWVEISQTSTPETWGDPDAPSSVPFYRGVPDSVLSQVVAIRFNDADGARRLIAQHALSLACIVLDPMPSRAGLIEPEPEFISAILETARQHDILVISDEVLNFRLSYDGASARFGIEPDLLALGKIIGGGLPIGAVGGRKDIMKMFDADAGRPPVPQGGTFSANPLSMAAGLAAMIALDRAAFERLERIGDDLRRRLNATIKLRCAPFCVTGAGSLFRIHPKPTAPRDFRESYASPAEMRTVAELTRFFAESGIVLPSGAAGSLSTPMDDAEIDLIVNVFDRFLDPNRAHSLASADE